jgi:hypothetical protein
MTLSLGEKARRGERQHYLPGCKLRHLQRTRLAAPRDRMKVCPAMPMNSASAR